MARCWVLPVTIRALRRKRFVCGSVVLDDPKDHKDIRDNNDEGHLSLLSLMSLCPWGRGVVTA